MREREADLRARGVRVFGVTFESGARVAEYQQREAPPFPILRDPGRAAYRAFGISRAPAHRVWAPRTALFYARQLLRGRLPRHARSDYYQLGGDVLLTPGGEVGWVYRSREPADRPSVRAILARVDDATLNALHD